LDGSEQAAPPSDPPMSPGRRAGRAGRNLPAAIGVGVTLGAIVIASLSFWRPAFVAVAASSAVCVGDLGKWARAVRPSGAPPRQWSRLVAGGVAMAALAWFGGAEGADARPGDQRSLAALVVAAVRRSGRLPARHRGPPCSSPVYVPFLGGFAVLLLRPEGRCAARVSPPSAGVVLSDTGGYVAGVLPRVNTRWLPR